MSDVDFNAMAAVAAVGMLTAFGARIGDTEDPAIRRVTIAFAIGAVIGCSDMLHGVGGTLSWIASCDQKYVDQIWDSLSPIHAEHE